jgi:hypothetical protein
LLGILGPLLDIDSRFDIVGGIGFGNDDKLVDDDQLDGCLLLFFDFGSPSSYSYYSCGR